VSRWETVTLEDVTVNGSHGLKRGPFGGAIKKDSFVSDGYKIYEQKHAIYGDFDSGSYFITETRYRELKSFAVEPGDLIVSCSGTLGRVAVVPPTAKPGIINQALLRIRPKSNLVSPRFLKMLLETPDLQSRLFGSAGGSAIKNVKPLSEIRQVKFHLPDLHEQQRIAEILDLAEELRSKRREAIAQLDTLTQAVFLEMFGNPVTNPFKFPFLPLENVISRSFQNGAYFPKEAYCNEGGVEMIHMSDAFEGIVKRGNLKRVVCSQQDIEKYKLSNTDLIIARRSLNYEGSVKPCLIPSSNEPLIFESSLIRITPNPEKVKILYLFYYILNPYVRERFIFPFVTQSTISGINQGNLAKVLLMLPPIDLQNEFARRVEAVEKLKAAHRASLSELDALFASLQHRAFRGEL
jgi:type I restriction enzyme S subunit